MTDSTQPTGSGWPSVVVILAAMIPLFLFWNPLRHLINEYRLYRRCQQYPHIVVCKTNSSRTASEQKSGDGIIYLVAVISRYVIDVLLWLYGIMEAMFMTLFTFTISETEPPTAETPAAHLSVSEEVEEVSMNASHNAKQEKLIFHRTYHFSSSSDDLNNDEKVQMSQAAEQIFDAHGQSEEIFESSFQNKDKVDLPMQLGQYSMMASALALQERTTDMHQKASKKMSSRTLSHRLPIQMSPTMPTLGTMTKYVRIDSSSLSEKMRKRRLNGGENMGYNAVSEDQDEPVSRKRRKLNTGRMPLQGCVARRPTVGAWQTTKMLDKREREEREQRLLRSMSRKRTKPTLESKTTLTTTPVSSTPAFNFGQTTADATSTTLPKQGHEIIAAVSTPAPAFQFGAAPGPSKAGAAPVVTEKKSQACTATPAKSTFPSSGNTSTSTSNTAATSIKPPPAAPTVAPHFQLSGPSGGAIDEAKNKTQQPTFGITPSTKTTSAAQVPTTAAPAPSSDATPTVPTQVPFGGNVTATSATGGGPPKFGATPAPAPTFGATPAPAPTFGATPAPAPTFGATPAPAPTFGATPAPASTFGATPAPAPTFGATPAPAPTFGATPAPAPTFGATPAPAPTFGATPAPATTFGATPAPATTFGSAKPAHTPQLSFGNTKENTNPGGFNTSFQAPAQSNGFLKSQPINGNSAPPLSMNGGFSIGSSNGAPIPSFGGGNASGMPGFSTGAPPAATSGASARRMARKARSRRR